MAFCAELADGLLLVGQAVRDGNMVRVPCHTGELNRMLGTQHTLQSDSCTLELPGKGEKNGLLVLWRTAARFGYAPAAFEASIATSRPLPRRKQFAGMAFASCSKV